MHPYELVFDVHSRWLGVNPTFVMFLIAPVVANLLIWNPRIGPNLTHNGYVPLKYGKIVAVLFLAVGILFVVLDSSRTYALQRRSRTEAPEIIEGCLQGFSPMPSGGHGRETLMIEGKCFSYSDGFPDGGFNQSTLRGGPVRPDARVRLQHIGGSIVRLELAYSACPIAPRLNLQSDCTSNRPE